MVQDLGVDFKYCNKSIAGDYYPQSLSTPIPTYGAYAPHVSIKVIIIEKRQVAILPELDIRPDDNLDIVRGKKKKKKKPM